MHRSTPAIRRGIISACAVIAPLTTARAPLTAFNVLQPLAASHFPHDFVRDGVHALIAKRDFAGVTVAQGRPSAPASPRE